MYVSELHRHQLILTSRITRQILNKMGLVLERRKKKKEGMGKNQEPDWALFMQKIRISCQRQE